MMIQRKTNLISLLSLLLMVLLINVNTVAAADRTEQTSIMFLRAIDDGDLDTAQTMLNSGADINYTNGGTTHALGLAVNWHRGTKYTTPDIVRFLLSRGANINARFTPDGNQGRRNITPLMKAIQSDYSSNQIRLMYIENGADIHAEDSEGNSVLQYAVAYLHFTASSDGTTGKQFIAHLVSLGADPNHKDHAGVTPFLVLANLLPAEGVNANSSYLPLVKYMIQHGADPNISVNGLKPIDLAFKRNNIPVYQYLLGLERGTIPKEEPVQPAPVQPTAKSTVPAKTDMQMPNGELNIGGIDPGQNIDYVEQVYGKPGKIDDQGFFKIYNYNDNFVVKAKMNNGFKVMSVAIYEKGLATPSGFTVGMPYADVVKRFGRVNPVKFKGEGVEAKLKGCTDYTYYSGDKQMVFLVDKKDVVQGIRVEELDEQKFIEAKRKK